MHIPRPSENSKEFFRSILPKELLEKKGASLLEPMKGKPMKEYVVIPKAWRNQPETVQLWVSQSLDWTSRLPPKKTKK